MIGQSSARAHGFVSIAVYISETAVVVHTSRKHSQKLVVVQELSCNNQNLSWLPFNTLYTFWRVGCLLPDCRAPTYIGAFNKMAG